MSIWVLIQFSVDVLGEKCWADAKVGPQTLDLLV